MAVPRPGPGHVPSAPGSSRASRPADRAGCRPRRRPAPRRRSSRVRLSPSPGTRSRSPDPVPWWPSCQRHVVPTRTNAADRSPRGLWVWRNERGKRTISWPLPFGKDSAMPDSDTPVMATLAVMTAASLESSDLPPREFMIARIAALVAVDATAASYALNVEAAADSGITLDDVEDIDRKSTRLD